MRAEVVEHDSDAHVLWMKTSKISTELEERGAVLVHLDVAIELVGRKVIGGHEVAHAVRSCVRGPTTTPSNLAMCGTGVLRSDRCPLLSRAWQQVERSELVHADDDGRIAFSWCCLVFCDVIEL